MRNGTTYRSHTFATAEEAADWVEHFEEADAAADNGAPLSLLGAMELLRREQIANGLRPASIDFTEQKYAMLCRAWPESTYLHRIGAPQVMSYMVKRREQKAGAQTIHHEVSLLKRLFRIGKRYRRLQRSPFDDGAVRLPKVRSKRFDHLPREQLDTFLERMRNAAGDDPKRSWEADVVEFLFLTGLRRAELARLRVDDVDPFRGQVTVQAKTDDAQVVHLAERTKPILGRLIAAADSDGFLIPTPQKDPSKVEKSRANKITHIVMRWKDELGLKLHGAAHVLRHSYGTELAMTPGMPFPLAQRSMRHKTPAMTMRYFHEAGENMRAAAEAVANGEAFEPNTPRAKKGRKKTVAAKKSRSG